MNFNLTILGSGSATPMLGRHPTAHLLEIDSDYFLVDCGEGTQYRLMEHKLRPGRLRYVFISHLHGDHYFGLVALLSSLNLAGRQEDLYLFGPRGLVDILTLQFRYSDTRLGFALHFQETDPTQPTLLLDLPHLAVESIPLEHRIDCTGYIFREKPRKRKLIKEKLPTDMPIDYLRRLKDGEDISDEAGNVLYSQADYTLPAPPSRSYAFCSDTRYTESFLDQIAGVEVLYHEATFLDDLTERAIEVFHSTARQAATIAAKAAAGRLLIGHFSSRYKQTDGFLAEARSVFPETYLAIEGQTIEL
ncbi:ribonuclease Z [Tellurirhabdus bombi]|uniref:ribonuclease Z n=1 Tax=Tellurirhabdus bombi TaxID=2907205 RepID=UPI001F3D9DEB|nr:ribonuclease Z [Tellurirhabdus bombi]